MLRTKSLDEDHEKVILSELYLDMPETESAQNLKENPQFADWRKNAKTQGFP